MKKSLLVAGAAVALTLGGPTAAFADVTGGATANNSTIAGECSTGGMLIIQQVCVTGANYPGSDVNQTAGSVTVSPTSVPNTPVTVGGNTGGTLMVTSGGASAGAGTTLQPVPTTCQIVTVGSTPLHC